MPAQQQAVDADTNYKMTIQNMQFKLLLTLLFIGQLSFGQTEKHIKVPGTKCSMIPPEGFVAATTFSGFQNGEKGASIMINELSAPYQTLVDAFTADALKTKGMTLTSKQAIDFNNSKATLISLTQPANGVTYLKQILIFGDANTTIMVNGVYPEASKNIESIVKEALLSTNYNASQNENPLDAATFSVNTDGTDFKVVKFMSGSLLYSTDGKIPTDKPTLIVGNSMAKISTSDQKQYAEERLKKLPRGQFNIVQEIKEITIDNLNGVEIVATGKDKDNNPELIYQVMLFTESGDYYIILGQSKDGSEKFLQTFKSIARTFKRK
jgi:hypothetical protein